MHCAAQDSSTRFYDAGGKAEKVMLILARSFESGQRGGEGEGVDAV
jgi:hypothetical protein